MKKTFLIAILAVSALVGVSAESIREDREVKTIEIPQDGRLKAGILVGMPLGATVGYRLSNWFEANMTVGYFVLAPDAAIISANGLFTLVNIPAGEAGVMPLSIGPQVNFLISEEFFLETVANLRLEYTFSDIPLNLFVEAGLGARFFDPDRRLAFNGGIGARYVF